MNRLIKIFFITGIFLGNIVLNAKEIPIKKVIEINLPIGVPSILDFPFNIEAVKATSFIYKIKLKEQLNELQPVSSQNNAKHKKNTHLFNTIRPIIINRTKRVITITPKKEGRMSLIIWGYKYPIVLDIKTRLIKNNQYDRYITFLDYSQDKSKAIKFEGTSHEKVIVKLIRYIYNNKLPSGYNDKIGTLSYVTNGIRLIQIKSYIGNQYKVEEWVVKNLTDKDIILYPQMFYSNNIYAVTFENNNLKRFSAIRMFIVEKNLKSD